MSLQSILRPGEAPEDLEDSGVLWERSIQHTHFKSENVKPMDNAVPLVS